MPIKYQKDPVLQIEVEKIANLLFPHVKLDSVVVLRSYGSSSKRTIARCHALGKAMQIAMGRKYGFYLIEVISERFDRLSAVDKLKTLIHELMHIPKTFGGGFKHHDYVCERNVELEYRRYMDLKRKQDGLGRWV